MDILSWNVNGLRSRYSNGHMGWVLDELPDILCVQETKGTENQLRSEIKGFDDYYSHYSTYDDPKYAGVGVYSTLEPISVKNSFGKDKYPGRILRVEYDEFILLNIYFPSGAHKDKEVLEKKMKNKLIFYSQFLEHMEKLSTTNEKVVVCGDFNIAHNQIDLANPKTASKKPGFLQIERALLDRLIANGFVDTFRMFNNKGEQYTWWSYSHKSRENNIGMRLDHIFVSENLRDNLKDSYIRSEIHGSDHCPIGINIEL